jgi:hypothetical protein
VTVDYDRTANFGAIKTFSLKLATPWGNPLIAALEFTVTGSGTIES